MQYHRKHFIIFFSLITLTFILPNGILAEAQLKILVNKGSFLSVKEAAKSEKFVDWWDEDYYDDSACTESFAAVELAQHLPLITPFQKEDIEFLTTESLPKEGDVILIGSRLSNPLIASYGFTDSVKLETEQSFRIKVFEDKGRYITIIEGKDRIGSLYGVYTYLEQLGIRFYGAGEVGTVYPDKKNPLPRSLSITENPSFLTRGFHAWEDRGSKDFLRSPNLYNK